jgi:hypothetical protein
LDATWDERFIYAFSLDLSRLLSLLSTHFL